MSSNFALGILNHLKPRISFYISGREGINLSRLVHYRTFFRHIEGGDYMPRWVQYCNIRRSKVRRKICVLFLMGFVLLGVSGCFPLNESPTAEFTATPPAGLIPLTITFNASPSFDPDGQIVSYEWDFGDGNVGSGVSAAHTYRAMGAYSVKLTVRDDGGYSDTASTEDAAAVLVPYDDLFRHNEDYIDYIIFFRGEIIQVADIWNQTVWRVATHESEYFGYAGDVIWVNYEGPRFLEGDIVDIYGRVKGLRTYTAIFGQQVTVPEVDSLHVELVQQAG